MEYGRFVIPTYKFEPAYMALYRTGELQRRANKAIDLLKNCAVCPQHCGINRAENHKAFCQTGRYARVASYLPHPGEENCLREKVGKTNNELKFAGTKLQRHRGTKYVRSFTLKNVKIFYVFQGLKHNEIGQQRRMKIVRTTRIRKNKGL